MILTFNESFRYVIIRVQQIYLLLNMIYDILVKIMDYFAIFIPKF